VDLALAALERHEAIEPSALTLLVRSYATGREDVSDALSSALGAALLEVSPDRTAGRGTPDRAPDWIWLLIEAGAVSHDDRLHTAAADLVSLLRREWPLTGSVHAAMRSLDACLCASTPIDRLDLVPGIIDELERVVGLTYRPGIGLTRTISPSEPAGGDLGDHAASASALLTAYSLTERLPYSMLAEELMQVARRQWWVESVGAFAPADDASLDWFEKNCGAARVLCRLAVLCADRDYRRAAVVAEEGDYAGDASRILGRLASSIDRFGLAAAPYGLALIELEALT
jgi:hypothetical protein